MALLGLFSKRDKSKSSASSSSVPKSSSGSVAESGEDYVLPEVPVSSALPSFTLYDNAEASSSKFHLGFHRKRPNNAPEVPNNNFLRPPQTSHLPSSRSEADVDEVRPPPSKAALFRAYGDPVNALSTRSLPADARTPSSKHAGSAVLPPRRSTDGLRTSTDVSPAPKKQGGLFAWAHRERKKSKPGAVPPELTLDASDDSSFNLKSFRHVRPESPSADTSLSTPLEPPVRPRPRNSSTASDTSQRISVAAFREMAARRSAAGSPTASPILLRPPSRSDSLDPFRSPGSSFQRSPVVSPVVAARSSSLAVSKESTSSESSESAESESEDDSTENPKRQRTITQKSAAGKAASELNHTSTRAPQTTPGRYAQSALGHSQGRPEGPLSGSPSSQLPKVGSPSEASRTQTPVSASAASPVPTAKQAALLISSRPPVPPTDRARDKARARNAGLDDSSDSSSEDSDDAPLASLVRPPRPGSSASNNTSGSRTRMPTKPLIDITKMTTPPLPPLPAAEDQPSLPKKGTEKLPSPPLPVPENRRYSQNLDKMEQEPSGSRPGAAFDKPSLSERLARVAQTNAGKSVEKLVDAGSLERRSLDSKPLLSEDPPVRGRMPLPTRSQTAPMDSLEHQASGSPVQAHDSPTARPRGQSRSFSSSSPNAAAAYDLTDPTPIVPTLIRQRSPPPAFSVTSRPPSQLSLNRLSLSQSTIRMVEPSNTSASSSPTTPNTPWTASGEESSVTTAHLQQRVQMKAPLGHFSSSAPAGPSPRTSPVHSASTPPSNSAQPSAAPAAAVYPSSREPSNQPPHKPSPIRVPLKDHSSSDSASSSRPAPRQRSATLMNNSTQRTSLIPNNGARTTDGFTGGGLIASVPNNTTPIKASTRGERGAYAALRNARTRASTLLPELENAPAPTKKITDREVVFPSNIGGTGPSVSSPTSPTSTSHSRPSQEFHQSQSYSGSQGRSSQEHIAQSHSGSQGRPSQDHHHQSQSGSQGRSSQDQQQHRFPQRARLPFDYETSSSTSRSRSTAVPSPSINVPPPKPFAVSERGNSPASSTGDSSSGRTPLTPADGSDYGYSKDTKSAVSAMTGTKKAQRRGANVSFEDETQKDRSRPLKTAHADEERRKDRRRSEAKAAIELGNVVNGRISLEDEDEDEIGPLNNMGPRMSMVNPMMNFAPPSQAMPWQQQANPAMMGQQQFMMQSADPRYIAAHQQAMMVAKQAYQMAVAQQAMAQANDEWERGSSTSAFSGMNMGMNPMMGMGMGGMNAPMGGMLPGGYGMQWTNPGAMMFPSSASMYAGSVMGSDVGVTAGWGTQSEYGGPSRGSRTSAMYAHGSARPPQQTSSARSDVGGKSHAQRPRTKTSPSDTPLPTQHGRPRHVTPQPPSSWRGGKP